MFKKGIKIDKQNILNKKDSRTVIMKLVRGSADDSAKDLILSEAQCDIAPEKSVVYLAKSDGEVMGVRIKRDEYYPSLYAIWELRPAMGFVIVRPDVPQFILAGAHLMLPGIVRNVDFISKSFVEGEIVLLKVSCNEYPFAIGKALFGSAEIHSAPQGSKGKAIEVIHYFGDGLWQLGSRRIPPGFSFDKIEASTRKVSEIGPQCPVLDSPELEAKLVLSPLEYDELVFASFFCAAKCLGNSDLPMSASALYSRMQAACRRIVGGEIISDKLKKVRAVEEIRNVFFSKPERDKFKLDLKCSSMKNVKGMFKVLEDRNFITLKEIRGEAVIVSIKFENPAVKQFQVPLLVVEEKTPHNQHMVTVSTLYTLNAKWKQVFISVCGSDRFEASSEKDLTDVLCRSILGDDNSPTVVDLSKYPELLAGALGMNPSCVDKGEVVRCFRKDLLPMYSLSTELPPRLRRGNPPRITVREKRVQGNKFCTIIQGLESYHLSLFQVSSGISGSMKVAVSVTEEGVYCQGRLSSKLVFFLTEVVGIPKDSCCTVLP